MVDERLVVLVASNARLQELGPGVRWGLGGVPEGVSPSPVACPRGIARGCGKSLPFHQVGSFVHMYLTYFYEVLLKKKKKVGKVLGPQTAVLRPPRPILLAEGGTRRG